MNLQSILALIPAILNILKTVEALFPEPGQGLLKLEMAQKLIEDLWTCSQTGNFADAWPKIKGLIDLIVQCFNASGVFKKAAS